MRLRYCNINLLQPQFWHVLTNMLESTKRARPFFKICGVLAPGKDSGTALFLAARGGQLPCLIQLLAANAELQWRSFFWGLWWTFVFCFYVYNVSTCCIKQKSCLHCLWMLSLSQLIVSLCFSYIEPIWGRPDRLRSPKDFNSAAAHGEAPLFVAAQCPAELDGARTLQIDLIYYN